MPKTIIIIEDDHDILDMMQYILEDEGYRVIPLSHAAPLDIIVGHQPQLILLDERLPEISGHEICGRIKSYPPAQNIPVILVSGIKDIEKIAGDCQADGYIEKPFDLVDLISLVKRRIN
jgi:two-component system phosphate regulon response regulator PhoB